MWLIHVQFVVVILVNDDVVTFVVNVDDVTLLIVADHFIFSEGQ